MNPLYLIVLTILNLGFISSTPLFFRGRPLTKHGMLGIPTSQFNQIDRQQDLPKAQWFEQKLDHFDPVDTRTWKQVCT